MRRTFSGLIWTDGSPSKTATVGWSFNMTYKRTVSDKKSPSLAVLLPVVCSVVASPPFIYDERTTTKVWSAEAEKCGEYNLYKLKYKFVLKDPMIFLHKHSWLSFVDICVLSKANETYFYVFQRDIKVKLLGWYNCPDIGFKFLWRKSYRARAKKG